MVSIIFFKYASGTIVCSICLINRSKYLTDKFGFSEKLKDLYPDNSP